MTNLSDYISLIDGFVHHRVSVSDFESRFLAVFKNDTTLCSEEVFSILNELFIATDSYCGDESIRSEDDITEDELRDRARDSLDMLRSLPQR